mgnify:CR=1 FL=1
MKVNNNTIMKKINTSSDGTSLGVRIHDIKVEVSDGVKEEIYDGRIANVGEPYIRFNSTGSFSDGEGGHTTSLSATCVVYARLTPRGKVKKLRIILPMGDTKKVLKVVSGMHERTSLS